MNNFIAEDTAATSAHRAGELLDQSAEAKCWTAREGYLDQSSTALRDALVGQGLATLAVRAELAGIAESLRLLAKTPAAIDLLASHVTAQSALLQAELRDTRAEVVDLCSSVEASGDPIATAIESVAAAVDGLAQAVEPRPRWWQRRRASQQAEPASVLDVEDPAQKTDAEVYEFLVEVRRQEDSTTPHEVLGRIRFYAEHHAACDMAGTMLPGLCAQLDVPADPDQVHGRVSRCDPDDLKDWYVGVVFLPGATVLDAPPGGF